MKIFISQPMRGKTGEQIEFEREQAEQKLRDKYGDDIKILDTVFDFEEGTPSLVYLGKSIEILAQADLAYFMHHWNEYRGCVVEYECAIRYGIKVEEEE